jgi:3-hydroxyacyl-CoA dehydrogenase/enoyl-CoA hydratase/3-hydroxybutyryl-CoA epimerase/3-hydroxyacyl-CoA dehydrogenase/enoyl-CoA hydratase/3-hydroxybutyryl-CoA epimerase/enoyl-CoA isomerase
VFIMNSNFQSLRVEFPEAEIALVTIDVKDRSANMLGSPLFAELNGLLDELESQPQLRAILFSSAKSSFVVGADLAEIQQLMQHGNQASARVFLEKGKAVFRRLRTIKPLTIALVHGVCLGGGAELAIWCDRRVFSDSPQTRIGFPEIKLGLIPGWGATARLREIVGDDQAVEMIAGGNSIDAQAAQFIGLADALCQPAEMFAAAKQIARNSSEKQPPLAASAKNHTPDPSTSENVATSENIASQAVRDLMQRARRKPMEEALQDETEAMLELMGADLSRALLHVFFLKDLAKKNRGVSDPQIVPQTIKYIAALGAGIMGQGIAVASASRGVGCLLYDIDAELLQKGRSLAIAELAQSEINSEALVQATSERADLGNCDLLVEAITENKDIKQQFYEKIEPHLHERAILATNTSTIPISQLGELLQHPDRFCGMHFFYPVQQRPLVEIIRGKLTSDQTVATAVQFVKRIGKLAIVVQDAPGFLVNRLLFPYVNESMKLIEEGATPAQIERAATDFGMPVGPLTLMDMIGLDTAAYSGKTMYIHYYHRTALTPILPALVKAKRFGVKTGRGFFCYESETGPPHASARREDPSLWDVIGKYLPDKPRQIEQDEITMRLFLSMLVEANLILDEAIVSQPGDVDLGLILGLGFPAERGGLFYWADQVGAGEILRRLEKFADKGLRYQPNERMRELAARDGKYYE